MVTVVYAVAARLFGRQGEVQTIPSVSPSKDFGKPFKPSFALLGSHSIAIVLLLH